MIFYIALDDAGRRQLCPTQADAKAVNRGFEQIDIPTDKAGLMAFVQELYAEIDLASEREFCSNDEAPVAVTLEDEGVTVIARFHTVAEAEDFLATSATIDPELLEAGRYGIDAPEEIINPPPSPSYLTQSINLDTQFDELPIARQLDLAARAMENARERL